MTAARNILGLALLSAFAWGSASCESPVEDALIAAQGDEVDGVPESEFHRYGQNCMACHGGYGSAPTFAIAGTVFALPDSDIPVSGADVEIHDAAGQIVTLTTNCAGNFYIEEGKFQPQYPLRVEVLCPFPTNDPKVFTDRRAVMESRINREGGCGFCHTLDPASSTSPGRIYCAREQPDPRFLTPKHGNKTCPGGPSHGSAQ
jgi:hypothetical protein